MTRGFVTLATGAKRYKQLAYNLLRSYRMNTKDPLPFAIVTDKADKWTKAFDFTIIIDDSSQSYVDKIKVLDVCPFDETIFIDSDSLIFDEINDLFDCFDNVDALSAFGKTTTLESGEGWFDYRKMGGYSNRLRFGVNFHGGMYFMRKGDLLKQIYSTAQEVLKNYSTLEFNGFPNPADETILALSMALHDCKPIEDKSYYLAFVNYEHVPQLSLDINNHKIYINSEISSAKIAHFGNWRTTKFVYKYEIEKINHFFAKGNKKINVVERGSYYLLAKMKSVCCRIGPKIKYMIKMNQMK